MDKQILKSILLEAKKGSANDLNKLVHQYQQDIYRHAKLYTGNKDLAKLIAKNAITKIFTHLDEAINHIDDFDSWVVDETMKKAMESILPLNPMEIGNHKEVGLLDDENKWVKIFAYSDGLSDAERTVLNLAAFRLLDIEEIKNIVHLSTDTVSQLLTSAKNYLNASGISFDEYSKLLTEFKVTKIQPVLDNQKVSKKDDFAQIVVNKKEVNKPKKSWKSTLIYILAGVIILVVEWFALDYFLGNKNKEKVVHEEPVQQTTDNKQVTETPTKEKKTLGKVKILKSGLHVRKSASTKADDLGTLNENDSFDVWETKEADGYTWYRIADSKWIANPSGYVQFIKK